MALKSIEEIIKRLEKAGAIRDITGKEYLELMADLNRGGEKYLNKDFKKEKKGRTFETDLSKIIINC
jgi:hypothetical protein